MPHQLFESNFEKDRQVSFKKFTGFPVQFAQVDVPGKIGIQELLAFKVEGTWARPEAWASVSR